MIEAGALSPGEELVAAKTPKEQPFVPADKTICDFSFILNSSSNLNSITGASVFIIACCLSSADPLMQLAPQILFLLGSILFVLSAGSTLVSEVIATKKVTTVYLNASLEDQTRSFSKLLGTIQLSLPTQMFLFGSVMYVIGSILFFFTSYEAILASQIVWAIGSVMFFYGGAHLLVKQQILSAITTSKQIESKSRKIMNSISADLCTGSGLMFCVGSASYLVNTAPFTLHGNIAWIIGSLFTIASAAVSMWADIIEKCYGSNKKFVNGV